MSCPSCGNLQCYICHESLKNYDHFDQRPTGGRVDGARSKLCPLYDNVEERHAREVKEAEAKARAEVVENNPDVDPEDLEIKVSDAVSRARAGDHVFGHHCLYLVLAVLVLALAYLLMRSC